MGVGRTYFLSVYIAPLSSGEFTKGGPRNDIGSRSMMYRSDDSRGSNKLGSPRPDSVNVIQLIAFKFKLTYFVSTLRKSCEVRKYEG